MDVEIIKQVVESLGLIISPLLAIGMTYYFAKKILRYKDNTDREITLLNDAIYYRLLIEKYKDKVAGHENKNYYNTFRSEVDADLGYTSSQYTTPSQIESRLDYLKKIKDDMDKSLPKINII